MTAPKNLRLRPSTPVSVRIERILQAAHEEPGHEPLKCEDNPGPWQDFKERPTREEAADLCDGCWFLEHCPKKAKYDKLWGVAGGLLFQAGKRTYFRGEEPKGAPAPEADDGYDDEELLDGLEEAA